MDLYFKRSILIRYSCGSVDDRSTVLLTIDAPSREIVVASPATYEADYSQAYGVCYSFKVTGTMDQGFPGQHTTTTTVTTTTTTTQPNIRFDPIYVRTVPGILKVVQVVSLLHYFLWIFIVILVRCSILSLCLSWCK